MQELFVRGTIEDSVIRRTRKVDGELVLVRSGLGGGGFRLLIIQHPNIHRKRDDEGGSGLRGREREGGWGD